MQQRFKQPLALALRTRIESAFAILTRILRASSASALYFAFCGSEERVIGNHGQTRPYSIPCSAALASRALPERCSHGFVACAMLCAVLTSAMWENACGKLPTKR